VAYNVSGKPELHEGVINITRNGTGFFSIGEGVEDLVIGREHLGGAFPYDIVRVQHIGKVEDPRTKRKREAGKVVEVVTRAREVFVGKLIQDGDLILLIPDWKRMYTPFVVKGDNLPLGHKVSLRFKGWNPKQEFPWGEVEEDIGEAGVHETEMRALALAQGFRPDFPPGVVKEAQELERTGRTLLIEGVAGRKDFRDVPTFTIDPVDAKDFDDALSVRFLDADRIEVGIHIADVSYFVRPNTAIDKEARHRATSVYLVDRTIPMLPHVLSTDLCSLNPNEDRLAMSAVFILDKNAGVLEEWFGETAIHSDKRFTYEEAQEVLDKNDGPMLRELIAVRDLAKKIRERRVKKGAIEFDTAEVKIELDADGKPVAIRLKERKETNLLIEDFMLLANENVAQHMSELGKQYNIPHGIIYRVHDVPDAERVLNLALFLKVLGYDLPTTPSGGVKGTDLNKLLSKVKGKPEEYLIKTATLRSMAKATYSTKNHGHYGLAFSHYTHFTSPIRRYPDLLVHRMLRHYIQSEKIPHKELEELETLAIHSSEREISATEAERDSIKMKQVEYMEPRIGETFDAVISGVTERGLYVEEQETRADGMIRISALGNDYFVFDEKRYRLVGERTKRAFSLGDKVRVTLVAARVPERELDFELVED
jgi:ribonuclease R